VWSRVPMMAYLHLLIDEQIHYSHSFTVFWSWVSSRQLVMVTYLPTYLIY
jgi:hypothetical protein